MIKSKTRTTPPTLSNDTTFNKIDSNRHRAVTNSSLSSYPKEANISTGNSDDDNNSKVIFRKLRKLCFKARLSAFDTSNPETNHDAFRGFYTLFWIAMGFYVIFTLVHCYEDDGVMLSLGFFKLMSQDTLALLVADLNMIGQTFIAVLFARSMKKGYLQHRNLTGIVAQHMYQTVFFFANLYWVFWRNWPMTQSIFFTLHTFVMLMKMHSYIELNRELSIKYKRHLILKEEIPVWIRNHCMENDDKGYCLDEQSELSQLETELKYLEEELIHGKSRYPDNLTFTNYVDYLAVPTLVYWMDYPRTEKIRPMYVFEKIMATLGTFLLLYITTERYICPHLYNPNMSDVRVVLEILFPFLMNYMLLFYIIFECILNWFAEITKFADRNFYDDWWNSVSFDEYARKWNKPVHHWLLRHVYCISIENYKISKKSASFVTFLFSSCLHEIVMVMLTRRLYMYLFFLQMFQLPLITLGRQQLIRNNPTLGNVIFWIGLFLGPPLLGILYSREAFREGAPGK